MRKLLLLPLLFMLLSCKKDEDIDLTVNELIKGEWTLVSYEKTTYNKSGGIHNQATSGHNLRYKFDGQNYTMHVGSTVESGPYRISQRNGKDYISFSDTGEGQSEIASISANNLVITFEYQGDAHPQQGSEYRTVIVQEFERP